MSDEHKTEADKLARLKLKKTDPAYADTLTYASNGIKTYSDIRAFYAGWNSRDKSQADKIERLEGMREGDGELVKQLSFWEDLIERCSRGQAGLGNPGYTNLRDTILSAISRLTQEQS